LLMTDDIEHMLPLNVTRWRSVTKACSMVFPCALWPASKLWAGGEVLQLLQH